mgnify:CR=1 FL=1
MKNWIVETANLSDAEAIAQFQVDMASESEGTLLDYELVLRGVREGLADANKGTYFVARNEAGQAIASLLVTREWSDWRCQWYWWIQSVFVKAEYRRQGVYRAMYETVRSQAIAAGSPCLRLYVDRTNTQGLSTYKALGMHESHYLFYEEEF